MHALNLIVATTTLALPHPLSPVPSVALPCRLHSLCNHVLSPSDEKLISIHSYQRDASSHCWHRWDCCVCSLYFWGHALELRRERLIFQVLWGREQSYSDEWVGWWFYYYMHFCLSDRTDQGGKKISAIFYGRHRKNNLCCLKLFNGCTGRNVSIWHSDYNDKSERPVFEKLYTKLLLSYGKSKNAQSNKTVLNVW